MNRSRRLVPLIGSTVAAGALLVGCGTSGGITKSGAPSAGGEDVPAAASPEAGGHRSAVTLASLRAASARTSEVTSGRYRLVMSAGDGAPGDDAAIVLQIDGEFSGNRSHQTMTMAGDGLGSGGDEGGGGDGDGTAGGADGDALDTEIITDGSSTYFRSSLLSTMAPMLGADVPADAWMRLNGTGSAMVDVKEAQGAQTAELLSGAYGDVTTIGTEEVDGVATTHVRVAIDPSKVEGGKAADLGLADRTFDTDVWVDDDGLIRRMRYEVDPKDFAVDSAQDVSLPSMIATFELRDVDEDVAIEVPPADQVVDMPDILGGN